MEKLTAEQVAWVFEKMTEHYKEGGSFRTLIYDRLGFEPENYEELYNAGGYVLSQILWEAHEEMFEDE